MTAAEDRLVIGGVEIPRGERCALELPIARGPMAADLSMPVHVVRGSRPGPTLFVSAAIHGDEINGVEVVARLLRLKTLKRLRGTLIAVPVVNVFGFIGYSRYLPDRRDLNRAFPGSERGSLAARLAQLFMTEIVANADFGIDLHTGALHRTNLPQLRVSEGDEAALEAAQKFGSLVVLRSKLRDGSLRAACSDAGVPLLVYEAGEALRFDEWAIKAGLRGVVATMQHLGMLSKRARGGSRLAPQPVIGSGSRWVRAPAGGIHRARARIGQRVAKDALLGTIVDPWGEAAVEIRAPGDSIVIGRSQLPVVNEGDALVHLLPLDEAEETGLEPIEALQAEIRGPVLDPELTD